MIDLKNVGILQQGIKSSASVTQAQKRHKTIALALNVLGSLVGALCVVLFFVLALAP